MVLAAASLAIMTLGSCNKEIEGTKVINVTLRGYNFSDAPLEVTVDTAVFESKIVQPNSRVNFSMVYPYAPGKTEAALHVKNTVTGADLFQETLALSGGQLEFFYPLININGSLLDITPPAADPATNKLSFYIYYKESNDPIDILMYNPNTGQQVYLAQNVIPQTWVHTDYVPVEGFREKAEVEGSTIYFLKAGTFDWAFNNDEYQSQVGAFGWYIPHKTHNLDKVQPYFIMPSPQGWNVEFINLFPVVKGY